MSDEQALGADEQAEAAVQATLAHLKTLQTEVLQQGRDGLLRGLNNIRTALQGRSGLWLVSVHYTSYQEQQTRRSVQLSTVKVVRVLTGLGLRDATNLVEDVAQGNPALLYDGPLLTPGPVEGKPATWDEALSELRTLGYVRIEAPPAADGGVP